MLIPGNMKKSWEKYKAAEAEKAEAENDKDNAAHGDMEMTED